MLYRDLRLTLPAQMRASSSGIATMGCHADVDGVHAQVSTRFETPHEAFVDVESIRAYLDGCERWAMVESTDGPIEEWTIAKIAGPFTVVEADARIGLTCPCGWRGPMRTMRARRLLNGDQALHRCPVAL